MPLKDPVERSKYQSKWMASRKAAWFADKVCAICGSKKDLQVDHVDSKTKDPILIKRRTGNIWSWSEDRLNAELAKCQALCKACHRAKTRQENLSTEHGTAGMYRQRRCKCELCREWKRQHQGR